ncbi:MAG: hypothetical protein F2817_21300 [Actinobacteria bacterium]|nr:hypothetical protein [Actinomycetota bacterium]
MTEATWGESVKTPEINWRMSASLENVPRGDSDVAEVTNLERAVRDWRGLDPEHQAAAVLTVEHPVQIEGTSSTTFTGEGIAALAEHLPASSPTEE